MILNCPSCSASYMVPSEAIGDNGRDVRCKKCSHVWFQKSEKGSLDDLIHKIQSTDDVEDDISFADLRGAGQVRNEPGEGVFKKIMDKVMSVLPVKDSSQSIGNDGFLKQVAGGMVAVAVVSVMAYTAVMSRAHLVHMMPSIEPIFTYAGFKSAGIPSINPEDALVLENVKVSNQESGVTISGNLINLTSGNVVLPKIELSYLSDKQTVLKKSVYRLNADYIPKEENVVFSLPIDGGHLPAHTQEINVSFLVY